ncbi:MAG TPA: thioredoxin-disulfide reductase [Myxococcales bacterium]|jgi:thioredoxin reductase (NADPH)|nr:thioredoxin-disulfide reductase [Myxococcales bacterium]
MAKSTEKLVIIGSGPAGYTAAIYAARAALNPLLLAGTIPNLPGGQLVTTTDIENFPGFPKGIAGPELMDLMRAQAERFGTRVVEENAVAADFSSRPFLIKHDSGELRAETVIISTGASAIWTNAKGEDAYKNRGVSACATCDGFFFKNLDVLVVGGGDTAMEEADYLTKHARKVTVVHRRDQLRASKFMQERVMKNPKISFQWNSVIEEIVGDGKRMSGAVVRDVRDGKTKTLDAQGMFVAIGHKPNTELFVDQLDLDPKGYLRTQPGTTRTSVPGVFAAGDVQDPHYRQAITAAASGCQAAIDAERFLAQ